MTRLALLSMLLLLPTAAGATHYEAQAHDPNGGALWLPTVGMSDLVFEPGAALHMQGSSWHLSGALRSRRFAQRTFVLDLVFSDIYTGSEYQAMTGGADGALNGTTWSAQAPDWHFAASVAGTIRDAVDPERMWTVELMDTRRGLHAQLGSSLNEKNEEMGLATWLEVTDQDGRVSDAGIHLNLKETQHASHMPEPSAALLFGIGGVVAAARLRRR